VNTFLRNGVIRLIDYSPLYELLKEKNLTPTKLGRFCDLHPTTMSRISKGEPVSLTSIKSICEFLSVPIEKIVYIDYKNGDN
jgi:DNA-binding Xre family transcriptional regulator